MVGQVLRVTGARVMVDRLCYAQPVPQAQSGVHSHRESVSLPTAYQLDNVSTIALGKRALPAEQIGTPLAAKRLRQCHLEGRFHQNDEASSASNTTQTTRPRRDRETSRTGKRTLRRTRQRTIVRRQVTPRPKRTRTPHPPLRSRNRIPKRALPRTGSRHHTRITHSTKPPIPRHLPPKNQHTPRRKLENDSFSAGAFCRRENPGNM
jgi:hypothetical protein